VLAGSLCFSCCLIVFKNPRMRFPLLYVLILGLKLFLTYRIENCVYLCKFYYHISTKYPSATIFFFKQIYLRLTSLHFLRRYFPRQVTSVYCIPYINTVIIGSQIVTSSQLKSIKSEALLRCISLLIMNISSRWNFSLSLNSSIDHA
jgi:hypothetical protein